MCLYEGIKTSRLWCCRCVVYHRSLYWALLRASEYPAWFRKVLNNVCKHVTVVYFTIAMFLVVPVVAILWIIVFALAAYFVFKFLDRLWRTRKTGNIINRNVLVTGCDSGFGHAIAKHLNMIGDRVFAACLTELGYYNIDITIHQNNIPSLTLSYLRQRNKTQRLIFVSWFLVLFQTCHVCWLSVSNIHRYFYFTLANNV